MSFFVTDDDVGESWESSSWMYDDNNYTATNHSRCVSFLSDDKNLTIACFDFFLGLLGLVFNSLIITVLGKLKRMRRSTRFLLIVIAITDLIYFFSNAPSHEIKRVLEVFGPCNSLINLSRVQIPFFYIHHSNQMVKIWTIVLLAAERCVSCYFPFRVNAHFRVKRLIPVLVGVVLFSLLISSPHIFNFHIVILEGEMDCREKIKMCKPYWQDWYFFKYWFNRVIDSTLKFFIPFISLFVLTIALMWGTSKQLQKQRQISPSICSVKEELECCDPLDQFKSSSMYSKRGPSELVIHIVNKITLRIHKRRWSINIMCISLLFFFLLCRLPTMVFNLMVFGSHGDDEKPIDTEHLQDQEQEKYWMQFYQVVRTFYILDATLFPFLLLVGLNSAFREQLLTLCKQRSCRCCHR